MACASPWRELTRTLTGWASGRVYKAQATCSQLPAFINEVLLAQRHMHLFTYCLCSCFCAKTAELKNCEPQSLKRALWPLRKYLLICFTVTYKVNLGIISE